jgi:hypothetical protein
MHRPSFLALSAVDRQYLLSKMWYAVLKAKKFNVDDPECCTLVHSLKDPYVCRYLDLVMLHGDPRNNELKFVPWGSIFTEFGLSVFLFGACLTSERLQFGSHKRVALARLLFVGWLAHNDTERLHRLSGRGPNSGGWAGAILHDTEFHRFVQPILDAVAK